MDIDLDTAHFLGKDSILHIKLDKDEDLSFYYYEDIDSKDSKNIRSYVKSFEQVPEDFMKTYDSKKKLFEFLNGMETKNIKVKKDCQSQVEISFEDKTTCSITIQYQQIKKQIGNRIQEAKRAGYQRKNKDLKQQLKHEQDSHKKVQNELEATKQELKKSIKKVEVISAQEAVPVGNEPYESGKKDLINQRTSNAGRTGMISFQGDVIGVKGVRQLISKKLSNIHTLDLYQNCLTDAGVEVLTRVNWPNLKILNLGQNQLKKLNLKVESVKEVTALGLECNFLMDLPENLKELKNLERIDLHENEFSLIPPVLLTFEKLLFIWFKGNRVPDIKNQQTFKAIQAKFKAVQGKSKEDELEQRAPLL